MTIAEAISGIDALKANTYTDHDKIVWLSELDGMIHREIITTHEGAEAFAPYDDDTPTDTVLLAEYPYDTVYMPWLEAKIDYYNGEYGKYNNSNAMFSAAYSAYRNWYNRTHNPNGEHIKYF